MWSLCTNIGNIFRFLRVSFSPWAIQTLDGRIFHYRNRTFSERYLHRVFFNPIIRRNISCCIYFSDRVNGRVRWSQAVTLFPFIQTMFFRHRKYTMRIRQKPLTISTCTCLMTYRLRNIIRMDLVLTLTVLSWIFYNIFSYNE